MVYKDVLTMLVRDMQIDCSIDERGKTKMFCFWRDIMSLVGDLTLLCFSTFFCFS